MRRVLVMGSPGTTFAQILPDLEELIPADPMLEVVVIGNMAHGEEYSVDWHVEAWARDRGNPTVVGFSDAEDAVTYIRGNRLIAFVGQTMGRCSAAVTKARNMRRWYSRPYKHYRPAGRWIDDRIRINVYNTGA